MKPDCVIFDLDGTIANVEHRVHMIKYDGHPEDFGCPEFKPDYDSFNAACVDDTPYDDIVNLMVTLNMEYEIIICTGRMSNVKKQTENWLSDNGIMHDRLMMRAVDDFRSDVEVKQEMLDDIITFFNVFMVFDDRDVLVKFWRSKGLTCLQVKPGDY